MLPALSADFLILLHLGFILFVVLGGFLVLHWPILAWVHLPAVCWGALIELSGRFTCPLTPLENELLQAAGSVGYEGGFIEHYIVPLIYPPGLTREVQIMLGILVLAINAITYTALLIRRGRAKQHSS